MRILLWSDHRYATLTNKGTGLHPRRFSSGSGQHLHDLLAKGLAELGHDVFYFLEQGTKGAAPGGITMVSAPVKDIDILHNYSMFQSNPVLMDYAVAHHTPWVATCHMDIERRGLDRSEAADNWIFVSRTHAQLYGRTRYVLNGIDPSEFRYSETKEAYFLFMSSMDWAMDKGFDIVLSLAKDVGFELVVAGTSVDYGTIKKTAALCQEVGARYVGDVRGEEKANLLAGARAVLHPSQVHEAFGLVMAEALMSGTPVICSARGACPEVISPEVGFVCNDERDYRHAIEHVTSISSRACRDKAMREYHYLRMAADYVREYEAEKQKGT